MCKINTIFLYNMKGNVDYIIKMCSQSENIVKQLQITFLSARKSVQFYHQVTNFSFSSHLLVSMVFIEILVALFAFKVFVCDIHALVHGDKTRNKTLSLSYEKNSSTVVTASFSTSYITVTNELYIFHMPSIVHMQE